MGDLTVLKTSVPLSPDSILLKNDQDISSISLNDLVHSTKFSSSNLGIIYIICKVHSVHFLNALHISNSLVSILICSVHELAQCTILVRSGIFIDVLYDRHPTIFKSSKRLTPSPLQDFVLYTSRLKSSCDKTSAAHFQPYWFTVVFFLTPSNTPQTNFTACRMKSV